MPGSQPPFSLSPDPDQNKKDASFIFVLAYGVYIPFHIRFNYVLYQTKFSKKCPRSCRSCIQDPGSEWVFTNSHGVQIISSKKSPVNTKQHGQSGTTLRSTVDHHVLSELTLKDKTPQGTEHVWW